MSGGNREISRKMTSLILADALSILYWAAIML